MVATNTAVKDTPLNGQSCCNGNYTKTESSQASKYGKVPINNGLLCDERLIMLYTGFKDYSTQLCNRHLKIWCDGVKETKTSSSTHNDKDLKSEALIDQFDSLTETLLLVSLHLNCQEKLSLLRVRM